MYSCGMGGALRCLAIADHLSRRFPEASFLGLTDLPILGRFPLPANFDYVHVPALGPTDLDAELMPHLRSGTAAARLRRTILATTFEAFEPSLVVVDRHPLGLHGELATVLSNLRGRGAPPRLVVGLPDVFGDPTVVRDAWDAADVDAALDSLYDEVWIYGVPEVFDTAAAYAFPENVALHYTGYFRYSIDLEQARSKTRREGLDADTPVVLVSAGSGKGGYPLLSAYLDFLEKREAAPEFQSHLVCGPFMPTRERKLVEERGRGLGQVHVNTFHNNLLPYVCVAELVVSSFGFNTSCELLSLGKRAVVVPSQEARAEQTLRANPMQARGLVDLLEPDLLDRDRLGAMVLEGLHGSPRPRVEVPLQGLDAIARRVQSELARAG